MYIAVYTMFISHLSRHKIFMILLQDKRMKLANYYNIESLLIYYSIYILRYARCIVVIDIQVPYEIRFTFISFHDKTRRASDGEKFAKVRKWSKCHSTRAIASCN